MELAILKRSRVTESLANMADAAGRIYGVNGVRD